MDRNLVECGAARRVALEGGPRMAVPGIAIHLAECEACRDFLAGEQAVAERLAEMAPRPQAAANVRVRVFRAVAAQQNQRRQRRQWVGVAAAAAVILSAGSYGMLHLLGRSLDEISESVAVDFVREQGHAGVFTDDAETAAKWFVGQADVAVTPLRLEQATLTGARICPMTEGRAAVLEYLVDGAAVGYYILPARNTERARFGVSRIRGLTVVAWRSGDVWHAMVSTLPEQRLREVAAPLAARQAISTGVAAPGEAASETSLARVVAL
ncbi:MAG: hypothetical protein SFU57_08870 [Gemmatimonadales bacterium]|nr:hypothetical protein [Gemmatimonadales bacterium]